MLKLDPSGVLLRVLHCGLALRNRFSLISLSFVFMAASFTFGVVVPHANVKDFGAKGDAKTDDTAAIQAAFDSGASSVFFPSGRYKISKTVTVKGAEVYGRGYPLIFTNDKDTDIFYIEAWRITVRGLEFRGGRDQISIGNANINEGFLVISNCRFHNSQGVAVRFRKKSNSSFCLVEKCAFSGCMQALIVTSDQTVFRDCWIQSSEHLRNKAVIENYNYLTCENIVGVPLVNGYDQRWIDNHFRIHCRNFRFGGEGGGFTAIVNYAKPTKHIGGSDVIIEQSFIAGLGNNKRPCALYLEEVPNQIAIRDCQLGGIAAVMLNKKLDISTYFAGVGPGMINFDMQNNTGELAGQIPAELIEVVKHLNTTKEYADRQLTMEETEKALVKAIEQVKKMSSSPEPGVMGYEGGPYKEPKGRKQQMQNGEYIDITPSTHLWDLEDFMDGTTKKNKEYLSVVGAGDDVIILRRIGQGGHGGTKDWPHIIIRNIIVDVDKTPYLTWRFKDNGLKGASYVVRVINNKTNLSVLLSRGNWPPFWDYRSYDLRGVFGKREGALDISVKLYMLGLNYYTSTDTYSAGQGQYWVLDFLRLEAESK